MNPLANTLAVLVVATLGVACVETINTPPSTEPAPTVELRRGEEPVELDFAIDTVLERQNRIVDLLVSTETFTSADALAIAEVGGTDGKAVSAVKAIHTLHVRQDKIVELLIEREVIENTTEGHDFLRFIYGVE